MPQDCQNIVTDLKLVREGVSQEQRMSEALKPSYIPVDERRPEHHIVFAQAYAAYLNYFDNSTPPIKNWQAFFSDDTTVTLAVLATQNVADYQKKIKESIDYLRDSKNKNEEDDLKKKHSELYSYVGNLAWGLEQLKERLPQKPPLKITLQNLIKNQLATGFARLKAYYKTGKAEDLIRKNITLDFTVLNNRAALFGKITGKPFSKDWEVNPVTTNESVYGNGLPDTFTKLNHFANHNLVTEIFERFLRAFSRVVNEAKVQLEKSYNEQNDHQPHFALFLAFVRLMELAREQTNTLTGRHLDFYYRDILQLREKPAEAGHVHLLAELLKNVDSFDIPKGTLFKAGKDEKGNEVFFKSDRELVVNQAKVTALKTIYRKEKRLYGLPITNTDDGLKPELTSPDGAWYAFKNERYEGLETKEKEPPRDEIGFAVASHYLWLSGGGRIITLSVKPSTAAHCAAFFTVEKGWLEKTITSQNNQFTINLEGDDEAIVPYNAKTHGYAFDTDLPVLMIKLKQDKQNPAGLYDFLKDEILPDLKLTVAVTGLKDLAVSNDFGPVDIAKPFQPFGALPQAGSSLVIGSKELFQKEYTSAGLNLSWQPAPKPYPATSAPSINVTLLEKNQWSDEGKTDTSPFEDFIEIPLKSGVYRADLDFTENEIFDAVSKNGFVKISLNQVFGFTQYQTDLAKYLIAQAKNPEQEDITDPGTPPVAPTIDALSLTYEAEDREPQFFHVTPFGQNKVEKPITLFPQFEVSPGKEESEAEFYIGITALNPPQNLSLLFQVADGTADPLVKKPKPHLFWSYLSNNTWIPFKKDEVNDTTGELLRSGTVMLTFSNENKATDDNTLMPTGMFWVKIAVKEKSNAICKLIRVAAQALRATFDDRNNDASFSAKILPAETISKLEEPQAAIKKIEQPFASFGGRGKENSATFYTRVSERLRHKDRAVALWDYERLILEAFPSVYKVKCLNHTRYEPNEGGGIYNELAPGHVTIVTIPNQQFQKSINPLEPYTSLGVLDEIETFLRQHVSCFVELHVRNPAFEAVKTDFKVKLKEQTDETYHINLLKEAITRFLSPWAFGGTNPTFGGKIYKSALINFVEEQPYVDYITDFKLMDRDGIDQNEIEPSKAISILVSVPKNIHVIVPVVESPTLANSSKCLCES